MSSAPSAPSPPPGRYTLLNRAAATFYSYLAGRLGPTFLEKSHRDEIARRLGDLNAAMSRASRGCWILVALLIFTDQLQGVDIAGVVNIGDATQFRDAIVFLLAANSVVLSMAVLDYLIVERCLSQIYNFAGIYSPKFLYMHVYPFGIWNDMIVPRLFGPKSTWEHKLIFRFISILMLFPMFLLIAVPPIFAILYAWDAAIDPNQRLALRLVAGTSILLAVGGLILPIVSLMFPVKFTAADFDEASGEPTKEFLDKLSKEAAPTAEGAGKS